MKPVLPLSAWAEALGRAWDDPEPEPTAAAERQADDERVGYWRLSM